MEKLRKKIGIFDSGIGGFSILKELIKILPGHQFFYISDKPNSPYGNKSSAFIGERCDFLTQILLEAEVDIVLVACNTATAEGIECLRKNFKIPFVGIEPFVKVIEGLNLNDKKLRPVVLTTLAMHESARFKKLLKDIDPGGRISTHACKNLASLIESSYEKGIGSIKSDVALELDGLKNKNYSHAILGCTHYPLISEIIAGVLNVECISPCLPVAKRVAHILGATPITDCTEIYFKISDQKNFKPLGASLLTMV